MVPQLCLARSAASRKDHAVCRSRRACDRRPLQLRDVRLDGQRSPAHTLKYSRPAGGTNGAPIDASTWEQLRGLAYVDGPAPQSARRVQGKGRQGHRRGRGAPGLRGLCLLFGHRLATAAYAPMTALMEGFPKERKIQWSRVPDYWLVLPPLIVTAIVYFPITRNYFYLDDFFNLYNIVNDRPLVYVLRENGGHVLVARNALFYLIFWLVGPHPELFYWSALLTHLLNVALLFVVILRLTGRSGLASFGALLWGSSPLQEGTLGWYSVYGHALVGTTLLIVLAQAAGLARRGQQPSRRTRSLWAGLALIGATSFGTGVALAMALPFALYLLLPPGPKRRPPLLALVVVVPLVYVGLTRLYEYSAGAPAPVR